MAIEIVPATADRFDDVASLLRPSRESAPACWCLYYRLGSSEYNAVRGADRPGMLRALCAREVSPGMLAYEDGHPIGWSALGPRSEMGRLERSRTIPRLDDRPVWSVVCFVVRAGHRRKGVARSLLAAGVEYAAAQGAEAIEGYPVDPQGARLSGAAAYVGTTSMFEWAGFERKLETAARRGGRPLWVMRKELVPGAD